MVRDGLRSLIEVHWPTAKFVDAYDEASVLRALEAAESPDLAIVDVRMPGMRGAQSFAAFRSCNERTAILVVTGLDDPGLAPSLLAHGATAVVSKELPADALLATIREALDGDSAAVPLADASTPKTSVVTRPTQHGSYGLSDRQRDMLRLLHEGLPNKLIARRLGITESTVKGHLHALYAELHVRGRTEAIGLTRDWLL